MRKVIRIIYRVGGSACLRHGLLCIPGLALLSLRISLEVHVGISSCVQVGTLRGFERQGLIQNGKQVGNGR